MFRGAHSKPASARKALKGIAAIALAISSYPACTALADTVCTVQAGYAQEQSAQPQAMEFTDDGTLRSQSVSFSELAAYHKAIERSEITRQQRAIGNKAVAIAKSLRGIPYVAGGEDPNGFDCSGFTRYVYSQLGIKLTHNAMEQFFETKSVASLEPGDLVFFGSEAASIGHVGLYVGNGKYIHAPQTGDVVRIEKLAERTNYLGATRPALPMD